MWRLLSCFPREWSIAEQMGDWAAAMGIEAVYIDKDTKIRDFKRDLMLGEVFYK